MWVFEQATYRHTMDDIKYANNIIRTVKPLGRIGFVFYCPEGEDSIVKFREGGQTMPRVFILGEMERRLYPEPGKQIGAFSEVVEKSCEEFFA